MSRRGPVDSALRLSNKDVYFLNGQKAMARVEGNNAAWHCLCGELLIGRCYYQFGDTCYTVCPKCGAKYRVTADARKKTSDVKEF